MSGTNRREWRRPPAAACLPHIAASVDWLALDPDLSKGNLPDFSFIRPGVCYSTAPPEDVGMGDAWVGQFGERRRQQPVLEAERLNARDLKSLGMQVHVASLPVQS